ncbi:hypothetical protein Tco_1045822 [Tanacetum coccineum]|uniref:Uncharacterized protein n=1 Tax=Tanacetum coccineum TaxID=301880 RepID=A0ABQ5GTX3_9ASTR
MIQPEPEDLPKDNPKLEIAVLRQLRMKRNAWIKGVNKEAPHILRQKPLAIHYAVSESQVDCSDIVENDIMDLVMQCTTLPSHLGLFSQQKSCLICHGDTRYLLEHHHSRVLILNMVGK